MIGSIGTLFMVFYISVTSTVLEPLQCQECLLHKSSLEAHVPSAQGFGIADLFLVSMWSIGHHSEIDVKC
eukprot:4059847-Amphidinium_carterae.1